MKRSHPPALSRCGASPDTATSDYPRQRLRVQPIIFAPTFFDQTHVARMRHDPFVPQTAQQPTDPRRMHPRLQSDTAARHPCERRLQRLGRGGNFSIHHDPSGFIQNAVAAKAIS
jgi:hypothetical protein